MPDEHHPDGASALPPEEPLPSGQDLDRLLADAADLAQQVSTEVGAHPHPSQRSDVPIDNLEADGTPLDDRMNELDQLLDRTAEEVGTKPSIGGDTHPSPIPDFMAEFTQTQEAAAPNGAAAESAPEAAGGSSAALTNEWETDTETAPRETPSASAPSSAATSAPPPIPDFMAEFTQPEPNASGSAQTTTRSLTPGVATRNPPRLGVVGTPVAPLPIPDPGSADYPTGMGGPADPEIPSALPLDLLPEFGESSSDGTTVPDPDRGKNGGGIAEKLAPLALPLAAMGVRCIELVDRPFARFGQKLRTLAGWLAIAMLAASGIVFLASLF